jgi:hypothetical protein
VLIPCVVVSLAACDSASPRCPDCSAQEAPACALMVCDPATWACVPEPVADGTPCANDSTCSRGEACEAGACMPGATVECGEPPICGESLCDPVTDRCGVVDAPDGTPCDTPCVFEGGCAAGECVGDAIDCSWLAPARSCSVGVCGEAGACHLAPVPAGQACDAADPVCATGACDGGGTCVESPVAEGTACDDGDPCTTDDGCAAGACAGVAITACVDGDECCAGGCLDDRDCCDVGGPVASPQRWDVSPEISIDPATGVITLTPALGGIVGQVWLRSDLVAPFTARFSFRAARSATAADGLVFMFYKDRDYEPGTGGSLGFGAGEDCPADGSGTGYGFEMDNYQGACDGDNHHFGLIYRSVTDHLVVATDERTRDGAWHEAEVVVGERAVDVSIDGVALLHWEGDLDRTHGGLGFTAATGGLMEEYVISDVSVECL